VAADGENVLANVTVGDKKPSRKSARAMDKSANLSEKQARVQNENLTDKSSAKVNGKRK
jgi:hypothetical protein